MANKEAILVWLLEYCRQNTQGIQVAVIALLFVIARAFYIGSEWRKVCGDVIFCPLIAVILGNKIPEIYLLGIHIDHTVVAALVGTAGMHGVRMAARWAAQKHGISQPKEKP